MGDLSTVNTNISALKAFLTLSTINSKILSQQERISTGQIVNRASDNPANYFISKKLGRDITLLSRRTKTLEDGVNFLQTNNTILTKTTEILMEMSHLANEANSISATSAEKQAIQQDLTRLRDEVNDLIQSGVSTSLYSGFTLGGLQNVSLTGTGTGSLPTLASLTIDGTNMSITGAATVADSISNINNAMDMILEDKARLGSFIRRLQLEKDIDISEKADTQATLSTIQDADLAEAQIALTKLQILQQSTLASLAQANSSPQGVLSLFKT
ncbi:flagellin, partial [Candidatus Auribacterota bacterium]